MHCAGSFSVDPPKRPSVKYLAVVIPLDPLQSARVGLEAALDDHLKDKVRRKAEEGN